MELNEAQNTPLSADYDAGTDGLSRRIADCLEAHLSDYGFEPYQYRSGENKSVEFIDGAIFLTAADGGGSWVLRLTNLYPPTTVNPPGPVTP